MKSNKIKKVRVQALLDRKALHDLDDEIEKVKEKAKQEIGKIRSKLSRLRGSGFAIKRQKDNLNQMIEKIRVARDNKINELENKKKEIHTRHENSFDYKIGQGIKKGISKIKDTGNRIRDFGSAIKKSSMEHLHNAINGTKEISKNIAASSGAAVIGTGIGIKTAVKTTAKAVMKLGKTLLNIPKISFGWGKKAYEQAYSDMRKSMG